VKKTLFLLFFFLTLSPAHAAYLDLAWNPNTEPDLDGYRVHYGTVSGEYSDLIDVGETTSYRLEGLSIDVRYYIALTAYDTAGNESGFSTEVSEVVRVVPTDDPPPVEGPRVTDGLQVLYTLDEGTGLLINDVSGVGTPLDLTISGNSVNWVAGGLETTSSAVITSVGTATKIIEACKSSNEITIEAWVKPADTSQSGPARIVTLSTNPSYRNFTLGQNSDSYDVRLRTTATSSNGIPSVTSPTGSLTDSLTHVLYTRDTSGAARIYINGAERFNRTVGESFSSWDDGFRLALANELTGDRPWRGQLDLVAIYSRALGPAEVVSNFQAGPNPSLNEPPVANCIADPKSGVTPLTVQFGAPDSTDPDGSVVLYEWDFDGDGTYDWNSGTSGSTTHAYETSGVHNAILRVTDDEGATDTESVTITAIGDPDSDRDGLPDEWEADHFGDLNQGPNDDADADGFSNLGEYEVGTDPVNSDTDSDEIPDGWEVQ
jgi:hypothetical protein